MKQLIFLIWFGIITNPFLIPDSKLVGAFGGQALLSFPRLIQYSNQQRRRTYPCNQDLPLQRQKLSFMDRYSQLSQFALHDTSNPLSFSNETNSTSPSSSSSSSTSTTTTKPLYDGTNYTFPDTTSPTGIAELIEVSFVHACMQLRTGYVDVLKLFIAAVTAGYGFGFSIATMQDALALVTTQTAGRPLADKEVKLRTLWMCIIYLTLDELIEQSTIAAAATTTTTKPRTSSDAAGIPDSVRSDYGSLIHDIVQVYKNDFEMAQSIPSSVVDTIVAKQDEATSQKTLSVMDQAIQSQSMRVVRLTLDVQRQSAEAQPEQQQPPPPPIPGAFE